MAASMKTRDMYNDAGILTGFEVNNGLLSRRRACRIAGSVQGAIVDRWPRRFSWLREDDFCAFSVDGVPFLIIEPFGDIDCYWIVAAHPDSAARPLIERVQLSFSCRREGSVTDRHVIPHEGSYPSNAWATAGPAMEEFTGGAGSFELKSSDTCRKQNAGPRDRSGGRPPESDRRILQILTGR